MSKIILLGSGGATNFDAKVQKWSYIFIGILFLIQGGLYLSSDREGILNNGWMTKLMFFSGFYAIIFAIIYFSKSSKFAPKVVVDDSLVEFKRGLFKKSKIYKWQEIQSIEFKSFRVDFKTINTNHILSYDCTSDISMQVKEAIREVAEKKNIEVVGG